MANNRLGPNSGLPLSYTGNPMDCYDEIDYRLREIIDCAPEPVTCRTVLEAQQKYGVEQAREYLIEELKLYFPYWSPEQKRYPGSGRKLAPAERARQQVRLLRNRATTR